MCCVCTAGDQYSWSYLGFYFISNKRPQHLYDPDSQWPLVSTLWLHVTFILKEGTPSVRFHDRSLDGGRPNSDVMSVQHGNTWSSSSMTSWVDVWKQCGAALRSAECLVTAHEEETCLSGHQSQVWEQLWCSSDLCWPNHCSTETKRQRDSSHLNLWWVF